MMTRDERLLRVERQIAQIQSAFSQVVVQLAEQNLRTRFVMDWFGFEKKAPGGVVDAVGRPLTAPEKLSLYQIYQTGGREKMIARLEAEIAAMSEVLTSAEQEDLNTFEQEVADASTSENGPVESPIETATADGEPAANGSSSASPGAPPQRRAFRADGPKSPVH